MVRKRIRKYIQCGILHAIYLLFVIWINNVWLLLPYLLIIDICFTKFIDWSFLNHTWITKNKKITGIVTPVVIAFLAAFFVKTFFIEPHVIHSSSMEESLFPGDFVLVNKVSYGPLIRITKTNNPFVNGAKLFKPRERLYNNPRYKRLGGLGDIQYNDVIAFYYPQGDSVFLNHPSVNYYSIRREKGDGYIDSNDFEVIHKELHQRQSYIKRCVGLPGDTIEIKHGNLFVNGVKQKKNPSLQFNYLILTDGNEIPDSTLQSIEYANQHIHSAKMSDDEYIFSLTKDELSALKKHEYITSTAMIEHPQAGPWSKHIFPYHENFQWSRDNFGPLYIPSKDSSIQITFHNLPLYERIINVYENNTLEVKDSVIYINGKPAKEYTFKMNYYWGLGDNRHQSIDSRHWGVVPENHITGKVSLVCFSYKKGFPIHKSIRWKNIFNMVE